MSKENLNVEDCIRTSSGIYMNVFNPTLDMICIEDIAHALSNMPRFGGHLPEFYSVAQHSIMCSYHVVKGKELEALLHDGSEGYLLDMPTPIKRKLGNYKEIENNLMSLIAEKFGFAWPMDSDIKDVDRFALEFEWNHLMLGQPFESGYEFQILTHKEAKQAFLDRFEELMVERKLVLEDAR